MTDNDFTKMLKFKVINGGLIPVTHKSFDYIQIEDNNEVYLVPATNRDLKFHAVYMLFTHWLWDNMPEWFKKDRCPDKTQMYNYLKLVQGLGNTSLKYKDIESVIVPSIAFGRMSEETFKEYVNEQIICFYENCLVPAGLEKLLDEAQDEFTRLFKELV